MDPDSVQTPVADVLVPVLAPPASPVVLVLDETAVALDLVLAAVFAAETAMLSAVFAAETVGLAVWEHCVWSAHRGRLLQSSSASLAFLALWVMPYAAVPLHT